MSGKLKPIKTEKRFLDAVDRKKCQHLIAALEEKFSGYVVYPESYPLSKLFDQRDISFKKLLVFSIENGSVPVIFFTHTRKLFVLLERTANVAVRLEGSVPHIVLNNSFIVVEGKALVNAFKE